MSGYEVSDNVCVPDQNGECTLYQVSGFDFIAFSNQTVDDPCLSYDGIFGFGPSSINNRPSLAEALFDAGLVADNQVTLGFNYWPGRSENLNSTITFGGLPTSLSGANYISLGIEINQNIIGSSQQWAFVLQEFRTGTAIYKNTGTLTTTYAVLNTTSEYITIYNQVFNKMEAFLKTLGFTCSDLICKADGDCDSYSREMQDLTIQLGGVTFTLPPAAYSYTKRK